MQDSIPHVLCQEEDGPFACLPGARFLLWQAEIATAFDPSKSATRRSIDLRIPGPPEPAHARGGRS